MHPLQGRIQDFKPGGGGSHLKKLRRAEGIFGVFRVKNHDFTPKNHIFSNFRGGAPPPPWIRPCFGSDHFVLISQHNFGEKLLYSHFPPIWKGGRNGYIAIFPGGGGGRGIYYIAIFPPNQVRGKYSSITPAI